MTANGKYLLAVDAASNDISVLKVHKDGSLTLVDTESSNGITPVSIAVHKSLVYVANTGAGGSNYTGFRLRHGDLEPIAGSTVPLPDNALPGQVLFSPNGKALVGMRVGPNAGPSYIDSFTVGHDGLLTAARGLAVCRPRGSVHSEARSGPTTRRQLFVSNAHDGPLAGSVSAYNVGKDASLTPIGASPFADNQTAPCWVAVSPDGRYLFAINTGSTTISRYSIAQGRQPVAPRQHADEECRGPPAVRCPGGSVRQVPVRDRRGPGKGQHLRGRRRVTHRAGGLASLDPRRCGAVRHRRRLSLGPRGPIPNLTAAGQFGPLPPFTRRPEPRSEEKPRSAPRRVLQTSARAPAPGAPGSCDGPGPEHPDASATGS